MGRRVGRRRALALVASHWPPAATVGSAEAAASLRDLRRIVDLVAAQSIDPLVREARVQSNAAGAAARAAARAKLAPTVETLRLTALTLFDAMIDPQVRGLPRRDRRLPRDADQPIGRSALHPTRDHGPRAYSGDSAGYGCSPRPPVHPRGSSVKAVLLAGGLGTRMREETEFRPKPMVEVGGKPVLWHIMKIFATLRRHRRSSSASATRASDPGVLPQLRARATTTSRSRSASTRRSSFHDAAPRGELDGDGRRHRATAR